MDELNYGFMLPRMSFCLGWGESITKMCEGNSNKYFDRIFQLKICIETNLGEIGRTNLGCGL